ncbi:hypothetical protein IWX49DRAFT_626586 [Phyllosticta citricarpa]|uniref:Uncharacterized protein n=1 Tax=Phyllosticta citricarpa TaxID=55181 RepID=A0ABR1LRL3_9PEZI
MVEYACSLVKGLDASEQGLRWSLFSNDKVKALGDEERRALMQKIAHLGTHIYAHFAKTCKNQVCSQSEIVEAADKRSKRPQKSDQTAESDSSHFLEQWLASHPEADPNSKKRKFGGEDEADYKRARPDKAITSTLSEEFVHDTDEEDEPPQDRPDYDDLSSELSDVDEYVLASVPPELQKAMEDKKKERKKKKFALRTGERRSKRVRRAPDFFS